MKTLIQLSALVLFTLLSTVSTNPLDTTSCNDETKECSRWGISDTGHMWDAAWLPGDYLWLQDDTDKAKCLTNLHFIQATKCISNEGSMCTSHGPGSKLLNAEISGMDQLPSQASMAIQDGLDYMFGTELNARWGFKITWYATVGEWETGLRTSFLWFRFGGDEQC